MLATTNFDVNTQTLPLATIGSVTSLLAATLYQINRERKHKREMYTPSVAAAAGMFVKYIARKIHNGKA